MSFNTFKWFTVIESLPRAEAIFKFVIFVRIMSGLKMTFINFSQLILSIPGIRALVVLGVKILAKKPFKMSAISLSYLQVLP